jgi:hypothetical protein
MTQSQQRRTDQSCHLVNVKIAIHLSEAIAVSPVILNHSSRVLTELVHPPAKYDFRIIFALYEVSAIKIT